MQWFGKAIGAALGMVFLGPPGAVLGAVLGHQFDQGMGSGLAGSSQKAQAMFFARTFEVMGHVAKVDGRISEEEIQVARRIMHAMHLNPSQVRMAIEHFTTGKSAAYPLTQKLAELNAALGQRPELARAFVEIQMQAAIGAGDIAQSKRELLWVVAQSLGLSRVELAQIEALLRTRQDGGTSRSRELDLAGAYKTLGVESGASDKEIKTAYRRLMNQHHPDKLVSKGLPESMITVAEQRTQQIRAAYERVRAQRRFK